jgi:hypothetical protein
MGCNVIEDSLFTSRLDFFPPNVVALSDKHGDRFHQDISTVEKIYEYARKLSQNMLADFCWNIIAGYKRMSYWKKF